MVGVKGLGSGINGVGSRDGLWGQGVVETRGGRDKGW